MKKLLSSLTILILSIFSFPSYADNPVKIGMITTLSTGGGYIGRDVRDAFMLAIDHEGGTLGGQKVEIIVEDDEVKPDVAKRTVDRMLSRDRVDIVTGVIFSNVAMAVVPTVLEAGKFYISPNAGPSAFAGEGCHQNYFVTSWQNDNLHEAAGELANRLGFKNAVILAANYPAGRDAATGFKRMYKGNIVEEIYPKFGQTDYAAEIAKIKNVTADAVFLFIPGGPGISFMKQYGQAGISNTKPIVSSNVQTDDTILGAVGDGMIGIQSGTQWNQDFAIPLNQKFVADFKSKYGRTPTFYASQGYDTALLIASALKKTNGVVSGNPDAFRVAVKAADFESIRGSFKFGNNNHPIQDWYGMIVKKGPDGVLYNETTGKILTDHQDAYAANCKL